MMRRVFLILLLIQISSASHSQIVADHTVVDKYDRIPQQYMDAVKKMLVDIAGESHSAGYRNGVDLLELLDNRFQALIYVGTPPAYSVQYLRLGKHADVGEAAFYTTQTAINAYKSHLTTQKNTGNPYSVIGFGWCWDMTWQNAPGGTKDLVHNVRWAGSSEGGPNGNLRWGLNSEDQTLTGNSVCMDTYIDAVEQYIKHCTDNGYSTKVIFTTGPVDNEESNMAGTENGFQREIKHDYIRNYVNSNNTRILFDYADILCYNNSGVKYVANWNDGGTLRPHANIHPDNMKDYDGSWNIIPVTEDGDHIGEVGALRLAKAMWWMLARIAGWDGVITGINEGNADTKSLVSLEKTDSQISIKLDDTSFPVTVSIYNLQGSISFQQRTEGNLLIIPISHLLPGIYLVVVSNTRLTETHKIVIN